MVPMGIVTIMWYVFLFSLCFGESLTFFGNPGTYFFMQNVNTNEAMVREEEIFIDGIPGTLFMAYQGMFAVITPALMTGAFANRFRFKPYVIFITLWMILVYAPFCHWVWGGGWMAEWGVWDFAGGIVVHITAGFSALAAIFVVGQRKAAPGEILDEPHNIPFVALGTALLWFGWFGFNGGSALGSSGTAVVAAVNSEVAASVALLTWLLIDWVRFGRPKLVGLCIGAIAGLATVTPAAGFIQPWGAGVLGVLAAILCYVCCEVRKSLGIDDALDVWGVHGMGGFIGTALGAPPGCSSGHVLLILCPSFGFRPANRAEEDGDVWTLQIGAGEFLFFVITLLRPQDEQVPTRQPKIFLGSQVLLGVLADPPACAPEEGMAAPALRRQMQQRSGFITIITIIMMMIITIIIIIIIIIISEGTTCFTLLV